MAALLGESRSWRTDAIREVRRKRLQVVQKRVLVLLSRLTPKVNETVNGELASALEKAEFGDRRSESAAARAGLQGRPVAPSFRHGRRTDTARARR